VTATAVARAPRRIDQDFVRRAGLTGLVRPASEHAVHALSADKALPVLAELRGLLPGGGLRRGSTVAVGGAATSSVVLALLAAASKAGSWCGVVGMPQLSPITAGELGVVLDRLAYVPQPGTEWATAVAALIDGLDIVVAAAAGPVAPAVISRLAARARQRGSVFVPCLRWGGADLTIEATDSTWKGLGDGHGRLRSRVLTLRAHGRGAAAIPREVRFHIGEPVSEPTAPDNVVQLRPAHQGAA
jgi:hypothetical protein